jgi:hypothetical protein
LKHLGACWMLIFIQYGGSPISQAFI